MPLPISLPYTFANATTAIPLSNLDSDLVTLRDGINGIGNGTNALSNVSITGGTITNVTITSLVAPLAAGSGGTGLTAPGTAGNVLTSNGTHWTSQSGANVTAVSTISFGTTGLTPNTATSGAVTVSGTLAAANGGTGITAPGTSGNVLTSNGTAWLSQAASGGLANVQTFNVSGTWNKPAGYGVNSRVYIQAWGAGGSGSRHATIGTAAGGGGGGYNDEWLFLSNLGATETVTVGAGGASRTASNQAGAQGGDSNVGGITFAYGGAGGTISAAGGGGGGQLSAGATIDPGRPYFATDNNGTSDRQGAGASATSAVGRNDALFHGGGGGVGNLAAQSASSSVWGGGGGGGGGTLSAAGTSSFGGVGGAGGATGTAGTAPGGGGGGGTTTSGAGAAGRVIVTVFPA